jgi:ABC-2 type transport system permease protein|tara:strand:+ start:4032 stop:4817 length:786 start_codon:yes stop_codon:yes gene_type:complete
MKFYRIEALLLKYYYITINRIDRLFDIIYWPVIDLFIWGFAGFYIQALSDVNVLSMLLGGVILWIFVWRSSQDIAVFVLEDFWSRNLYHLFASPIKLSEHLISIIIVGLLRALTTFAILWPVGIMFYSFNILRISPLLIAVAVFLLTLFGWAVGLFIASFIFRFGQRIQVLAWSVTFLLTPFAAIFYPISALPQWAARIAVALPPAHIFEALRALINGNPVNYYGLAYAFTASFVFFIAMAFFLVVSFKKARKTGLLVKGD